MASTDYLRYQPLCSPTQLRADLADSQRQTAALLTRVIAAMQDDPTAMQMPRLPIVNPLPWELGHVAWFQEFWVHRRGDEQQPARVPQADALFNSSIVPHRTRWDLPLPPLPRLQRYLTEVAEATDAALASPGAEDDAALRYFAQLALFHQDMHNEAFAYSFQTVGWAWQEDAVPAASTASTGAPDLSFDDATISVGASPSDGFVFDNEKWAHPVHVPAFSIAAAPVSHAEFRDYVQGDPEARMPRDWRCRDGVWEVRAFDRWQLADAAAPVCHVSALEAEAWCRWRGRRLPTEVEWLRLAQAAPDRAFAGVWEWTASVFAPFPGFTPDPYADYSQPWFDGGYRVLKGASRFTPARLCRSGFRNFYPPARRDPFCGFRTCALA